MTAFDMRMSDCSAGVCSSDRIVDAAIVDGVTSLMSFFAGLVPSGAISLEPGQNWIGGGAPFYRCYRCADGRDIAVGAVEQQFYRQLLELIGAPATLLESPNDHAQIGRAHV